MFLHSGLDYNQTEEMYVTTNKTDEKNDDEPSSVSHSYDSAEDLNYPDENDLISKKEQIQTAG